MRLISRAAQFWIASVLVAPAALGLSVIPPTFEVLVAEAEVAIEGEVVAVRSEMAEHQGRPLVYTYVTIRVLDSMKGAPDQTIELRMLGGTVGDFTMQVSGVPKFRAGDHDLFFIVGNGSYFCPLVGVTHGYYPIGTDEVDGTPVVRRSNGEPLATAADVEEPLERGASSARAETGRGRAMKLDDFKRRVREEVARAREQ
jgi:hypothetical protein